MGVTHSLKKDKNGLLGVDFLAIWEGLFKNLPDCLSKL